LYPWFFNITVWKILVFTIIVIPQVDGRAIFLKYDKFPVILCLAFSAVIMLPFMATMWYGMVWYGMVWYGMVWYGMVWYGMVWYGMGYLYDENLLRFRCRTSTSSPI
jgi:hypothetical protein